MPDETVNGKLVVTDKVGIGIEEPIAQLHIASSTTAPSQTFLESGGALLKLSVDASGAAIGTDNAFPLNIQTDSSSRISINSAGNVSISGALSVQNILTVSGNVGIGTSTAPTAKLEVNGTVKVNSLQIGALTVQSVSSGTPPTNTLQVNGAVKATSFQGNGTTLEGIVKKAGDTITGLLTVQNTLTVTGNVGIGTSTPSQKLEVVGIVKATAFEGNGATLSGVVKAAGDTMTGALAINNNLTVNGNVGIGTAKPRNPLGIRAIGISEELISFEDPAGNTKWHINQNLGSNKPGLNFVETDVADGRLFIQVGGNVGIGTTSPNFGLDVRGNNGWIGSGDSSQSQGGWRLGRWPDYSPNEWVYLTRANSTRYQDLAVKALWAGGDLRFGTADDLAEMTPVKAEDNLEPGDVVVIENPPDNRVLLARSNKPYDSKVAGVISDANTAGLIIGGSHPTDVNRDDIKPLALAGRVLTKVTTENGFIKAGDFLTTSSTPGHAMKATVSGHTLGKALQSFNNDQNGENKEKIWVLVNLGMR